MAYYATTISLNIIATSVICVRLIYLGRAVYAIRDTEGRGKGAIRYTGTLPMIVESALPYSMAGLAFLVSYGMQSDISILFGALYGMFTVGFTTPLNSTMGIDSLMLLVRLAAAHRAAHSDGRGLDQGQDGRVDLCLGV